tara:strand:+ start:1222 stop:2028 length:807 start_codon:yes stop_codon:yes gene_type:complete
MQKVKPEYIPADVYHADPAYSASDLKLITSTCPQVFYQSKYEKVKLEHEPALKKAFRVGELCHAFTLEPDRAKKAYGVCLSRSTKAGKVQAEEMTAKGIEPITSQEYELASNVANAVWSHPIANKLLSVGLAEQSFWKEDKETGLTCKARCDFLDPINKTIVDLKTTGEGNSHPDKFIKSVANYLYHLQAAHYLEVVGAKRFVFIAVEKVYPYAISIIELDEASLDWGFKLRQDALKLISKCHTDAHWHGYTEEIQTLSLPSWAYKTN